MSEDKITITRKYVLKPTFAETKEWTKKIMSFTKNSYEEKIDYYKKKVKSEKDKKKKEQYKNRLSQIEEQYKDFIENGTLIRSNINDYTYDLVRRSMESETRRKNHIITYMIGIKKSGYLQVIVSQYYLYQLSWKKMKFKILFLHM